MLIYRVLNSDSLYDECLAYKMNASSLSGNNSHQENLNTFDYSQNKYKKHFFVFAEDAKNYLDSRNYKDWYSIGEFEITDEIAIEFSGLGIDYKKKNFPLLEIALPENQMQLREILTPEEKEIYTAQYCNNDKDDANAYFDLFYRIKNLEYTGNLYKSNSRKIKEKYRDTYILYQKLWKEFMTAYCASLDSYNTRIYTTAEPNLEERAKMLRKCNLIK